MIVKRYRVVLLVDVVDSPENDLYCLGTDIAQCVVEEFIDIEDVQVETTEFVEELPA